MADGTSPRKIVGRPLGVDGTSAWPSFRRANPPRRLNNARSPRFLAVAPRPQSERISRFPSGDQQPKRSIDSSQRGSESVPMGFPSIPGCLISLKPPSMTVRWKLSGSRTSPPRRFVLPYCKSMVTTPLTPRRLTPQSGRNVTSTPRTQGFEEKNATKSIFFQKSAFCPLTLARPDPKYPVSAGRSHLLRDDARPRYPLTVAGYPPGLFTPGSVLCCR